MLLLDEPAPFKFFRMNERVPRRGNIYGALKHKRKTTATWCTDDCLVHHDGRHSERQPRRAAQPISSADSGGRSVAARRSWMAPGMSAAALLSLTQQFTVYKVGYWKYPINQQEECFGGSIVPYMHRTPLDIVGFERKGGEVVEL